MSLSQQQIVIVIATDMEEEEIFGWDQTKVVDKESRLFSRKIKEAIHSLKNPNHINKISCMLPEIWLPDFRHDLCHINRF